MEQHFNQHQVLPRKQGRPRKVQDIPEEDQGPMFTEVYCQRFFAACHQSSFFVVYVPSEVGDLKARPHTCKTDLLKAVLKEQLQACKLEQKAATQTYSNSFAKTEVSPWLKMTRWPRYFDGLDMTKVAPLAYMPNPLTEATLVVLGEGFNRIIEQAYTSIYEDRISVFDQAKINSFIADRSAKQERLIIVKLQKGTFQAYKDLWKRLLCFVYRTSLPSQKIPLLHRFTTDQLFRLDQAMVLADELMYLRTVDSDDKMHKDEILAAAADMDKACLMLCISLLDHTLQGNHFESVILSFLAVLGIDEKPGGVFRSTLNYSPDLSKFIKMAQMLVVQRAITGVESGEAEHPSDLLDEMRVRFMTRGTRTAFDWACRLRAYAKKVVSNTTSLGYIMWSEDAETVRYRDTSFSMGSFRDFIATQVEKAQRSLEDLLLLHPKECRQDVVPSVALHRLKDDHSNGQKGWNFLNDPRNAEQLREGDDWLFNRVLENDWLKDEMVSLTQEDQVIWKKNAVQAYFAKLDQFLEQMLLLIHITSGQPARGTELLSLQHSNTAQGHHRNVFIEEGLISTVTSYHKGYNITGSTKIIHRYLPKEVSELLVYYLWLVLPFSQKLDMLVYKRIAPLSSFLWPKGTESWKASRLTSVLSREGGAHFKTPLNILIYRHIAIAISRQHLSSGGFKRDYGVDKKLADEQATHGTWVAGTVYARGLQEAPGHVKMRSTEYRIISREWHSFLGFRVYLGVRKRPLGECRDQGLPSKRTCM
jgi:hypothetical protein